jgi:outer membrane biosynthesis protein TonB
VAADGTISNVTLAKTSGFAEIDDAALACVREQWRNTPAYVKDVPIASPDHLAIVRFTMH